MHFAKASLSLGINVITLTNHFVAAKSDAVATPELCGKGGRKKDPVTTLICSDASSVCRDIKCNREHNCAMNCKHKWGPVRSSQAVEACLNLWTCDNNANGDCYSAADCIDAFGGCPAQDTGCEL